jgi:hypothetical protein
VFLAAVGADGEFGALTAGPTPSSATTTVVGGGGEDADLLLLLLDGRFRLGEQCAHLGHRVSRVSRGRQHIGVGPCWILASESWDSRRSPTSLHIFAKSFFQSVTPTFAAL